MPPTVSKPAALTPGAAASSDAGSAPQRSAPTPSVHSGGPTLAQIKAVHVNKGLKKELRKLALGLPNEHGADLVGRRCVIAVGSGYYGYGRTRHKCLQCPRTLQIGAEIARNAMPVGK